MDKKYGCYICTGCGIGEALDVDALSDVATDEHDFEVKTHQALCSPDGVEIIKKDIEDGFNALLIAACSPRAMHDVFDFDGCLVERANLREHVIWGLEPAPEGEEEEEGEDIQMAAEDYLHMGCAKLEAMEPPEPYLVEDMSKTILVVGGGKTGLTAALEAAKAGYEVCLVEKEPELGGFIAKTKMSTPRTAPYRELEPTGLEELIAAVNEADKIEVLTAAKIEKIKGAPGKFEATISINGSTETRKAGAIIQATGWKPYDPTNLADDYGYGKFKNVVTNVEFEEMAKAGEIKRPSDGGPVKSVAFIQCAGSRDPNHLPYCSAICCQVSMKQAAYLKEADPECATYIIYRDIRTPGQFEEFYRKTQEEGTVFIRAENKTIGDGFVEAEDELLGETVKIEDLDLIVLATGMVPTTSPVFAEAAGLADEAEAEEEAEEAEKSGDDELVVPPDFYGAPILNLDYRQGGELPLLKNDFVDSNFICFPYETRRTGIYAAGPVRRPMGTAAAMEDAAGAALKAIQSLEALSVGRAVHPRTWEFTYPEFAMQRCTQCKRCTEECPFGAINEDEKANPLPEPSRCRRCGVCMGACPERIISFKNYSVSMIGDMIKSFEVPDEDEEKPRIIAFVCENDAYPALDMAAMQGYKWSRWVRFIPLRCLGSLNLVWIADSLSAGIDGILLLGCRHGDDYQCHFVKGSQLAEIRMSKIKETLERLVLEPERIRVEEASISDTKRIVEIVNEFAEAIEEMDPNPYKGF